MLDYSLYEFILSLPSCQGTLTLATVLEIFEQTQCDRIIVLNEEKMPVGLLNSTSLLRQLLVIPQANLQQKLENLSPGLIEPVRLISAKTLFQDFCQVLKQEYSHRKHAINLNWIVVDDADNMLLGVLDNLRVLKYLSHNKITQQQKKTVTATASTSSQSQRQQAKLPTSGLTINSKVPSNKKVTHQHPLIQLLERLPWPLMLQTTSGEVVTQNPAWWQQLGMLKDPEGIRQEVEMLLAPFSRQKQKYVSGLGAEISQSLGTSGKVTRTKRTTKNQKAKPVEVNAPGRCFLDDELGTCTCVVEVQTGQERVWQFAKIPLDSPELKAYGIDAETTFNPTEAILHANLWLMLATDVTEKQQLCKELAAKNADLIQLNRLKDEFLACISHELKTPLTSVLGLSRLLVEQQLGELNERQARYAGLIHQSGRHLMTVVNDILDLTRMETGQMELTPATVDIQIVCDRAIAEAKTIHQQSSKAPIGSSSSSPTHQFTLNIQPGLEEIVADELRLRQMLVHLFSNALKFTETGGKIGLKVSRWEGWIAFTIWDTGIGIPEHQQHLIFQKFQQLENPLTRQFEGTGLGLVLTRALARLHGGDVSFLSREGKGSQFTLLLPPTPAKTSFTDQQVRRWSAYNDSNISNQVNNVNSLKNSESSAKKSKKQPRNSSPQNNHDIFWDENAEQDFILHSKVPLSQPVPNSSSSQRLVLVVEAVGRYIEDLTEQLTGLGYRVVIARSGCEAVEKARRLQPKAIFLNPLLPLLSGWDVLTLLKSDSATRGIKVIVTATAAEKEQAFTNRADSFLSLPVQHQMLAPTLEALQNLSEPRKSDKNQRETITTGNPLRILRLVEANIESNSQPFLSEHRIIEVDDLEQADVLSKVWDFDVILLDAGNETALNFLAKLIKRPRLSSIPLVTCSVETTQAASQIEGLSVFPCLASSEGEDTTDAAKTEALLSVLQIAAGVCCPPSILVVDLTVLPDLPQTKQRNLRKNADLELSPGLQPLKISHGCEWFQALIQYLQTAGLKSSMARSWAELLQQIRHRSIDLLLVCLSESADEKQIYSAINALSKLPFELPPVLVLDRRVSSEEIAGLSEPMQTAIASLTGKDDNPFDLKTQVLPRSTSMEDLLNRINVALKGY